jgi:hypothetical protein
VVSGVGIQILGPLLEDWTTIDLPDRLTRLVGGYAAPPAATLSGR